MAVGGSVAWQHRGWCAWDCLSLFLSDVFSRTSGVSGGHSNAEGVGWGLDGLRVVLHLLQ